jgi:hypothetical protein
MVPIHLGLIERPFVPHNLISSQESPVPLPKFQMPPRIEILMSSWSKKGTQIYFPFLSKCPSKQILSHVSQWGPYRERYQLIGHFYISFDMYLFISKSLRKKRPSMFLKSEAPMETDTHSRALLNISFRVPSKGALPKGLSH